MDETYSSAVLKGFQSLWLVSSLSNRLTLLEFQATAKTRSSFCPEGKHWIDILNPTWHTARSQCCHSRKALRSSSPNFHCARRSRRWLRKKVQHILLPARSWHLQLHGRKLVVRATLLKVQASCKLVSQASLHCRKKKRQEKCFFFSKKNIVSTKCQSTTSTTWRKERTCMAHACRYQK